MRRFGAPPLNGYYPRGQAAVEFALAATVFLLLTFAIIEMAMVVYSYNTISHAARECVRYAIVHSPTGPSPASAAQIEATTVAYADLPAPNQLTSNNVTISWPADPNMPSLKDAQCSISLNYSLGVPFLPPKTLRLTATARMLVSQ
jgi:Flp pilus assembly protein TadG